MKERIKTWLRQRGRIRTSFDAYVYMAGLGIWSAVAAMAGAVAMCLAPEAAESSGEKWVYVGLGLAVMACALPIVILDFRKLKREGYLEAIRKHWESRQREKG